jgi:DNA-binding transcriptional MerR regulator
MDNENYISPNKITKQYDITSGTLRRWAEAGKIKCLRPNGGKRIYNIEDIKKIFNSKKTTPDNEDTKDTKETEDTNTKENTKVNQNTNTIEHEDDIKNVLKKLKQNIESGENMNSIDDITSELNDIMILINHIKKNGN